MSDEVLAARIREVLQDASGVGAQHPLATGLCLPLIRFAAYSPAEWSDEERRHVLEGGCPYCQRMLALSWTEGVHPGFASLVDFAASIEDSLFGRAIAYHLDEGGCESCASRLRSPEVGAVSTVLRTHRWVKGAFCLFEPIRLAAAHADGTGDGVLGVEWTETTLDGRLTLTRRVSARAGRVSLEVKGDDGSLAGRVLVIELVGERETEGRRCELKAGSGGGVRGFLDLGSWTELNEKLGPWRLYCGASATAE